MDVVNAVYSRTAVPSGFRPSVEGYCPARYVADWVELTLPDSAEGEATARALSKQVPGVVIWIRARTAASQVSVVHCEGGQVLRRIEFDNGACRKVAGQPRLWEGWLLGDAEVEAANEVSDVEGASVLKAVFESKTLAVGDELPWPREWEVVPYVLGLWQEDWLSARKKLPFASFEGSRKWKASWTPTLLMWGTWLCVLVVGLSLGGPRGVLKALFIFSLLTLVAGGLFYLLRGVRSLFRRLSLK
ncbi:hypothetical protein MYSTI_02934 [Myxococcus stipitatus DSM 14675]|uniref:Uncharacterized protein n=1 Tax=Myxococcus stipitatus (strain DSM 14675 / JCM 12634 / Mx s8) TaxID=1278073 RepID=L7U8S2_MYXSD|nr:hypothetical protein [Myxococcus stipitatus]AGC44250.1 hypothetical protein MYSTI_02934 [Myxococcus stipitatus DSM 14675]